MNSRLSKSEKCPIHNSFFCCGRENAKRSEAKRTPKPWLTGERVSPAELRRRKHLLIKLQSGKCAKCGEPFTEYRQCEPDHKEASKMGGGFRDDSTSNLQVLCKPCHRVKHGVPQWSKPARWE